MMDLSKQTDRVILLSNIRSENNKARKQYSFRSFEVQSGRIHPFVKDDLLGQYNRSSVKEMPLVSSINVQKRVVDAKSTIYKQQTVRTFTELTDEQSDGMQLVYRDMCADEKLNQANKGYNYQDQTIGMIVPKDGKLIMRIFKMHQIDAIVDDEDPESSKGFVISTFDRTMYEEIDSDKNAKDTATGFTGRSVQSTASQDQDIEVGEKYQFQKYVERYLVWTPEYNFFMNGLGEIIDEDGEISSPLASEGIMPFFEVAREKDFEYFVRPSNNLTDFTIQFNSQLSDQANVIKMSSYSVAVLKAPSELQPQDQVIGASQLLKLPTDDPDKVVDFSFESPSSDMSGISEAIDKLLNYFITSEGLGGTTLNSNGETDKATSGIDRFIQGVQKIEAHRDDYEKFRKAEEHIYKIVKAWINVLRGSDKLDKKYQISGISDDSEIIVAFHKPELIQTENEKLTNIEKKMELGIASRLDAIMIDRSIEDKDEAKQLLEEIDKMDLLMGGTFTPPSENEDMDLDSDNMHDDEDEDGEE